MKKFIVLEILIIIVFWYGHYLSEDNFTRWYCAFVGSGLTVANAFFTEAFEDKENKPS